MHLVSDGRAGVRAASPTRIFALATSRNTCVPKLAAVLMASRRRNPPAASAAAARPRSLARLCWMA